MTNSLLVKINYKSGHSEYISVSSFEISDDGEHVTLDCTYDGNEEYWRKKYGLFVAKRGIAFNVAKIESTYLMDRAEHEPK